jgi:hypothetical protein
VLSIDDLRNAGPAEDMLAVGNDWTCRYGFYANRALFLALDVELKCLLQKNSVLVIERNNVLVFQKLEQVRNTLFA